MNQSKLEQLANLVPATPKMIAEWLMKIENAGQDTLAIVLTCFKLGYDEETHTGLLNELHTTFGVDGVAREMETIWRLNDAEQQYAYMIEFNLTTDASIMLANLAADFYEFKKMKRHLEGFEL